MSVWRGGDARAPLFCVCALYSRTRALVSVSERERGVWGVVAWGQKEAR